MGHIFVLWGVSMCYDIPHLMHGWVELLDTCDFSIAVGYIILVTLIAYIVGDLVIEIVPPGRKNNG